MQEPLPTIWQQKKFAYRTSTEEVTFLHHLINNEIFDNVLPLPIIEVKPRCRKYWGMCYGEVHADDWTKPFCKIRMMDKWYSRQWVVVVLAHEMCHQYQWDIYGPQRLAMKKDFIMSHGPSFFQFKDKLKEHGVPLAREYSRRKWFKHQSFYKHNKRLNTLCAI